MIGSRDAFGERIAGCVLHGKKEVGEARGLGARMSVRGINMMKEKHQEDRETCYQGKESKYEGGGTNFGSSMVQNRM